MCFCLLYTLSALGFFLSLFFTISPVYFKQV